MFHASSLSSQTSPCTLIYISRVSVSVLLVLWNSQTASCSLPKVQHSCDKINLVESSTGQIISPTRDYGFGNISYPARLSCAWYIKIQPGSIVTLRYHISTSSDRSHNQVSTSYFWSAALLLLTWRKEPTCAVQNRVVVTHGSQYWAYPLTLLSRCSTFTSKTQSTFSTVAPFHYLHWYFLVLD